jgi:hypothetical protein
MADELTQEQRDALVRSIYQLEASLYVREGPDVIPKAERPRTRERMYAAIAEYADRLPRVRLSVCPYCEQPLRRVFDPFGLDGPWWHVDVQAKYEEPVPCEHFRVLLGALYFGGRTPVEAISDVRPGPEVPFVVPKLLALPGMICVAGRLTLATGDSAYPLAYFSDQPTRAIDLHQPWLRTMFWFTDEDGSTGWSASNARLEFDLRRFVENGQFRWTHLDQPANRVYVAADEPCPFLNLPGTPELQQVVAGNREFLGVPSGQPMDPFGE